MAQWYWSPWYSWNIAESGVKTPKSNHKNERQNQHEQYNNRVFEAIVTLEQNILMIIFDHWHS